MKLIPVVLSGGAGTRLWPASRHAQPKPFMRFAGKSLLEQAIRRGQACGAQDVLVVTHQEHYFLTQNLVAECGLNDVIHYVLEPHARNTAPAIAQAALLARQQFGDDCVLLILAADHLIPDESAFVSCAMTAAEQAAAGAIVTFGIQPLSPETGYGYIEVEQGLPVESVKRFVEKPALADAIQFIESGRHYWNSGIFCLTPRTLIEQMRLNSPDLLESIERAAQGLRSSGRTHRYDGSAYQAQPSISIDYALIERATRVVMVKAKFGWSDVGSWPSIGQAHVADSEGNTKNCSTSTKTISLDTHNTHLHVESHGPKVVATIGLRDVVIVDTPDALLVTTKQQAQQVKSVVSQLQSEDKESVAHQSTILPPIVHRPWGSYTTLKTEDSYKLKVLQVRPGQSLSLQLHEHRDEHWVVVEGLAIVQVEDQRHQAKPGDYFYIRAGQQHRLINESSGPFRLVEVQTGSYLAEEDIIRLADEYGRA